MRYSKSVWNQLKNIGINDLIAALEKDGFKPDTSSGSSIRIYYNKIKNKRVSVHFHPKKTFGEKLLKGLLEDIGWNEQDMKKLKLIK